MISVEVVYALPDKQRLLSLQVPVGTTAAEAVELSGIRAVFSDLPAQPSLGIFSRKVPPGEVLRAGDRVEIYRPLLADPKEVRRARAAAGKNS